MRLSRPNARSMLLLHGTLLIYAVVSVFAKLAGLRLAAQDAGMTLAFLAAEAFGLAFFGEKMTWGKAAGLVVVLAGVALVVTDHE